MKIHNLSPYSTASSCPTVMVYDFIPYDPSNPRQQEAEREYQEGMEALRQWRMLDGLITRYPWLAGDITSPYIKPPYAVEELRQISSSILKDDAAVKEIMDEYFKYLPSNPKTSAPVSK